MSNAVHGSIAQNIKSFPVSDVLCCGHHAEVLHYSRGLREVLCFKEVIVALLIIL